MTHYATKNLRADIVKTNLLSEGLPPMGMWDEMVLHQKRFRHRHPRLEKTSIRIEVSPSEDESRGWTLDDWEQYATRLIAEMNRTTRVIDKGKPRKVKPIDMTRCQYFAALHKDSESGIHHLHVVVNRIDEDGRLINDSFIGERAVAAADVINREMGWRDPMDIHAEHLREVSDVCLQVLRELPRFSWQRYKTLLEARGYEVMLRESTEEPGKVHGYTVKRGNSTFKASDLGTGRNLTAKNILQTHAKLHPKPVAAQSILTRTPRTSGSRLLSGGQGSGGRSMYGTAASQPPIAPQKPDFFSTTLDVDGKNYGIRMSNEAHDALSAAIVVPDSESQSHEQVMNVAMLLFMEYVKAATAMSESYGGGGSPGTGWGRDKKDDDQDWARRCAAKASWLCKPIRRTRKK